MRENDVLIEAVTFVCKRKGAVLKAISVAKEGAKGRPSEKCKAAVRRALEARGISTAMADWNSHGVDAIVTIGSDEFWVEAKGLADGKPATHRNNLDRVVASSVAGLAPGRIPVIALPDCPQYLQLLPKRLPASARRKLGIHILLVKPNGKCHPVTPSNEIQRQFSSLRN